MRHPTLVLCLFSGVLAACSGDSNASDEASVRRDGQPASSAPQARPSYDPATEASVVGVVTGVREVQHGGPGAAGVHLDLAAEAETYDVHLGPGFYLDEIDLRPVVDDELEIVGSVRGGRPIVLIAREVRRGDRTWTLRDPDGRPKWRGAGRRAAG